MNMVKHFLRAHLGAAIAATATAVVLVGGILILTLSGGAAGTPAPAGVNAAPTTSTTVPAPSAGAGAAHHHQGVRGQITAIASATWTVTSAHGAAVTVEVTPATAFGSKAVPLAASDFSVGDTVVVSGTRTKSTVIATRIAKPKAATAPTTTPTTVP